MPASGPPYLYWINRYDPYVIQSAQTASSGKVAIVRITPSGNKGKSMKVAFRMATASDISTWTGYTGTFSMFSHTVIWAPGNAIQYQNEVLQDADAGQTPPIDYFKGTMNFLIVS